MKEKSRRCSVELLTSRREPQPHFPCAIEATLEMTSAPANAHVVNGCRLVDCWNFSHSLRQASRTVGKLFSKSSDYIRCRAIG